MGSNEIVVVHILLNDSSKLLYCIKGDPLYPFRLELLIERFHKGVVVHLLYSVHTLHYAVSTQTLLIPPHNVFNTSVRVKDKIFVVASILHRMIKARQSQISISSTTKRPADNLSTVSVHNGA